MTATGVSACGGGSSHTTKSSPQAIDQKASYQTLVDAGTKLLAVGNRTAAEQLLSTAVAKNPTGAIAHYDLGVVYQGLGDTRDAMRQYNLTLHYAPQFVSANYNFATLLASRNAPLAIFFYRKVTSLQPNSPTAFLNLGLLELARPGLRTQAYSDLKQAVILDPAIESHIPAPARKAVKKAPTLAALRRAAARNAARHHFTPGPLGGSGAATGSGAAGASGSTQP